MRTEHMLHQDSSLFCRIANDVSRLLGSLTAFGVAVGIVVLWGVSGPLFEYSDSWQLVINTGTTIVTFLMVFLIQNTQNRDSAAIQLKLDEIIRCTQGAHNALLDLERLSVKDLDELRRRYETLAEQARLGAQDGRRDTDTPDMPLGQPRS
ncbi:MAG: low affinity iron permease family protein [Nitrospira sp.]|nr:low affinity iron permease family protein [Nitrospira sp.]